MKIAIMSDSHDNWQNLSQAIKLANAEACELLLFAGDFIAPPGIKVLEEFNGQIKFVWGNNDGERVGLTRKLDASDKIELCGDIFDGEVAGIKVFMNHYPEIAELAAKSGNYDLVVYGHTHEYHEEKVGNTALVNPGEIQGYLTGDATFIILETEGMLIRKIVVVV